MIRFIQVLAVGFLFVSPSLADTETDFVEAYRSYSALVDEGKTEEAIPFAERSLELGEQIYGPDHETVAILNYNLALALALAHESEKARDAYLLTIKRYENLYGRESLKLVDLLGDFAHAVGNTEVDEAARYHERAWKIAERHYGKEDPKTASYLLKVGNAEMRRGDGRAANSRISRALRILEDAGDEFAVDYGIALFHMGKLQMGRRSYRDAEKYFLKSLERIEPAAPETNSLLQTAYTFVIQLYERMERREDATPYVRRLSSIRPDPDENSRIEPLFRVIPSYPPSAGWTGKEGYVDLRFTVDEQGYVKDIEITEAKPRTTFNKAAIECVEKWRYKPQVVDGEFVPREGVEVRITFELED